MFRAPDPAAYPAALRLTLADTITPVTFTSEAAAPGKQAVSPSAPDHKQHKPTQPRAGACLDETDEEGIMVARPDTGVLVVTEHS